MKKKETISKRTLPRCYKCNQVIRDKEFQWGSDGRTAHLNACPMPPRRRRIDASRARVAANRPGPLETLLGRMRCAPSTAIVTMHCEMCGADAAHYLEPAFTPSGEPKILCQDCRIGSAELLESKRREMENTVTAPSGKRLTKAQAEARAGLIPESDWLEREERINCLHLDKNELATVLASLRLFQRTYDGKGAKAIFDNWEEHFTDSDGKGQARLLCPLGTDDIDALCERINFAE